MVAHSIEAIIADAQKYSAPGIVLSVMESNGSTHHFSSGLSDLKDNTPAQHDQSFLIGKNTRLFVAVMLLKLVEQGRLNLDAPLDGIARENQLDSGRLRIIIDQYTYLKPVTVRELLNNTSGLSSFDKTLNYERAFFSKPKKVWQSEGYLDLITGYDVGYQRYYEPAVRGFFNDSMTNYIVAGLVFEAITGIHPSQQLPLLFKECGLKNTLYFRQGILTEDAIQQLAHGYLPLSHPHAVAFERRPIHSYNDNKELQVYDVTGAYNLNGLVGGAAASSTADLLHWIHSLMQGKILTGTLPDMFTTTPVDFKKPFLNAKDSYGLGIYKTIFDNYGEIVWSTGNTYGYGVLVAYSVDKNISFSLAVNVSRERLYIHNTGIVRDVLDFLLL